MFHGCLWQRNNEITWKTIRQIYQLQNGVEVGGGGRMEDSLVIIFLPVYMCLSQ